MKEATVGVIPSDACFVSPNGKHFDSTPVNGLSECLFCGRVMLVIVTEATATTRAQGGG